MVEFEKGKWRPVTAAGPGYYMTRDSAGVVIMVKVEACWRFVGGKWEPVVGGELAIPDHVKEVYEHSE
jgi:hypothetical protein